MKQENNLTQGNLWKVLISFSVPFLIANIIQALYGAVDLMVIGRFCDASSVAAVSTGTQVTQIITSLITGLTLGGTILTGKYTGMEDKEGIRKTIGTTLTVFLFLAGILTIVMLLFVDPVLRILKTPQEAFGLAKTYVVICSCGILFICGYNAISAILRGYGDSTRPMLFTAIACVLNIVLDILFTGAWKMGVAGVALATVLSQGLSMVCAIVYLNKQKFIFTFKLSNLKVDSQKLKELAVVGIPVSLQELMVRISFLYLLSVTNRLGVYAASAVGIASKYDVFAMLPATSMAGALAAITAQNYGAGKPKRAQKSLGAGVCFALCAASVFFLWAQLSPESMIGVFSKEEATIKEGIAFFKTCSFDYLAVSVVFCLNGYLNGRGYTIFTMISCCLGALCLRMPMIYWIDTYRPDDLALIGSIAPIVSGFMAVYTLIYVLMINRRPQKILTND